MRVQSRVHPTALVDRTETRAPAGEPDNEVDVVRRRIYVGLRFYDTVPLGFFFFFYAVSQR